MSQDHVQEFLALKHFAVFGASDREHDMGHQVLKRIASSGRKAYPVNPRIARIGPMLCYGTLDEIPVLPQVVVVALPPGPALEVLKSAFLHGVKRFWMQPGSESGAALTFISDNGLTAVCEHCLCEELEKSA